MSDAATEAEETAGAIPAAEQHRGPRSPMPFKYKLLIIIIGLVVMGVLRTGFIFIIVALMPGILAYYTDRHPGRFLFKCVFVCNITALLPYFMKLVAHGPHNGMLQLMMNSMHTWITIFGGSLMGYLLVKACPNFVQFLASGVTQTQINYLEQTLVKIEKEWGAEVKQLSIQHDQEDEDGE